MISLRTRGLCSSLFIAIFVGLSHAQEPASAPTEPLRVACIGDSTTYGSHITNRDQDSYPAKLQSLLADQHEASKYRVVNFGSSGATCLQGKANWSDRKFNEVSEFAPQIAIISLGTNDTKPQHWQHQGADFKKDMIELITKLRDLPSHPQIYLCQPVPITKTLGQDGNQITPQVMEEQIRPLITEIAKELNCPLIDLNTPLIDHPDFLPDGVHPTAQGTPLMAAAAFAALQQNQSPQKTNSTR